MKFRRWMAKVEEWPRFTGLFQCLPKKMMTCRIHTTVWLLYIAVLKCYLTDKELPSELKSCRFFFGLKRPKKGKERCLTQCGWRWRVFIQVWGWCSAVPVAWLRESVSRCWLLPRRVPHVPISPYFPYGRCIFPVLCRAPVVGLPFDSVGYFHVGKVSNSCISIYLHETVKYTLPSSFLSFCAFFNSFSEGHVAKTKGTVRFPSCCCLFLLPRFSYALS